MKFTFILLFLLLSGCSVLTSVNEALDIKAPKNPKANFHPVWIKNLDPQHETGNLPIALNSPLIHEGIVYVGENTGKMMAFDLSNGRKVWEQKDNGAYHSKPVPYKKQIIYGTIEGRVFSRHYLTGKIKYSVDLDASIESPPVIYKGRMFFHLRNHKIFCLDVSTGKILWAYKRSVPYLTTLQRVSTPTVSRNRLFVGFADGYVASFGVEDGILLWEKKIANGTKFVDIDMRPVIRGKRLYVSSLSSQLNVLNVQTGALLQTIPLTPSRSPLLTKGGLVIGTLDGELVLLNKGLKEVFKKKISKESISSIKSWKKHFVVTTSGKSVFFVDKASFKVVEKFDLGHSTSAVFGDAQVNEDKLAFLSSRNRLYVFE
ncbi:MAG: PQQ-binding-like beta-propeller repeat protein [Bacteriovoracaceae bacterium]|nr:PQQ-binding-like beta-propeller repeat protein [Bacteriovoracaceae bacterium]